MLSPGLTSCKRSSKVSIPVEKLRLLMSWLLDDSCQRNALVGHRPTIQPATSTQPYHGLAVLSTFPRTMPRASVLVLMFSQLLVLTQFWPRKTGKNLAPVGLSETGFARIGAPAYNARVSVLAVEPSCQAAKSCKTVRKVAPSTSLPHPELHVLISMKARRPACSLNHFLHHVHTDDVSTLSHPLRGKGRRPALRQSQGPGTFRPLSTQREPWDFLIPGPSLRTMGCSRSLRGNT